MRSDNTETMRKTNNAYNAKILQVIMTAPKALACHMENTKLE